MKKTYLISYFLITLFKINAQNISLTPNTVTVPRLNYEAILALTNPTEGQIVYDLTFHCLRIYNGNKWLCSFQNPSEPNPMTLLVSSGGTNFDSGQKVVVDASGNIYVTGYYSGTATFGTTIKVSVGQNDIFVAKYNNVGILQWVQSAGGTSDDRGYGIAIDATGNVYITGSFFGNTTFGSNTINSTGGHDIFILKYNSDGIMQWVQSAGGASSDYSYGIASDGSGNVYITGYYTGSATFSTTILTSNQGILDPEIFLAKYNSSGVLQWVQSAGGNGTQISNGVALDGSGNIYITGSLNISGNFGSNNISVIGYQDIFVAKYNNFGNIQWVKSMGGSSSSASGDGIAVDGNGNVFVTGVFTATTYFGDMSKTSTGDLDAFVFKCNSLGNIQWVQSMGGIGHERSYGIGTDSFGDVCITGYFENTINLGTTTITSVGNTDIFVIKYNSFGSFQWGQTAGGVSGDQGNGITVDTVGNIYITGYYMGTATFGVSNRSSAGGSDIFVAKIAK
ncbi:SBBP repeat-containing protein [Emticicia sp. SJ17W-69]|uniref:SBBP repeat-containing protein n=1 Tax=Emticicia sp. SJ17W-69 TaxID=3421657 RepID=UPI003EC0C201